MGEEDAFATQARSKAGKSGVTGIVFDAGGLIALERNDRRIYTILKTALEDGARSAVLGGLLSESGGAHDGRYSTVRAARRAGLAR